MSEKVQTNKTLAERVIAAVESFGLPRMIIALFLLVLFVALYGALSLLL